MFILHVGDFLANPYKFKAQVTLTYEYYYEAHNFCEACGRVLMVMLVERYELRLLPDMFGCEPPLRRSMLLILKTGALLSGKRKQTNDCQLRQNHMTARGRACQFLSTPHCARSAATCTVPGGCIDRSTTVIFDSCGGRYFIVTSDS